jgi:hypothetical protein
MPLLATASLALNPLDPPVRRFTRWQVVGAGPITSEDGRL